MVTKGVGVFAGALFLFIWQFLSWSVLGVHADQFGYAAQQDSILQVLDATLEPGRYLMPAAPPGSSSEEQAAFAASREGQSWAHVSYHHGYTTAMGMHLVRGFAADVLAAALFVWLLLRLGATSVVEGLKVGLAAGMLGFLTIAYLDSIWFNTQSLGYLIDTAVQWGVLGAGLGWWLSR